MAITVQTGFRSSYVDRTVIKDNIDQELDYLEPTELPFLSYIGFAQEAEGAYRGANSLMFECTQQQHTWLNDSLIPTVSSLASPYTAAAGSFVVPDTESERFAVDDLVTIGDTEFIVTSLNHGTNTVSVTALHNDANQASGAEVRIIGNARVENTLFSAITSKTTEFGQNTNYTQIFMDKVSMTGTERSTVRHGVNGDPYDRELQKTLTRLGIQLEGAALYGLRNTTYPANNSTARRMGGLAYWVRDNSSALVVNANSAVLDEVMLNDLLEDIWAAGGNPDTIMVNSRPKRLISSFLVPAVRVDRDERMAGVVVGGYESDFGTLNVVMNRWMKQTDLIVLSSGRIGIGPLNGNGNSRAFFTEVVPRAGDGDETAVTGEYTMEVRNPTKEFGWIENLG